MRNRSEQMRYGRLSHALMRMDILRPKLSDCAKRLRRSIGPLAASATHSGGHRKSLIGVVGQKGAAAVLGATSRAAARPSSICPTWPVVTTEPSSQPTPKSIERDGSSSWGNRERSTGA